ncbi:hypothetical protein C2845_PM03G32010 [Panicum miliaceum]|uniref:PGG domain-containing protein n=1 Tax=Panicum miliaceum TaxID=4540 RepID=A0A3L6TBP6_PANMI|nr:hypothetical protein C2845_PM03G32010 [Panicum miliaceum]
MMVATARGDCQRLKELVTKEDATTMVVVMSRKEAPAKKPTPASMHPLLAEAACRGNWEEINFLLDREDLQEGHSSNRANRSSAMQPGPTATDVEEGISAMSLLKGVTVEGDTALHLVAANGEDSNFVKCAVLIHGKDKGLLSRQNYKGDTPLHCAARAGKSQMVSHLIVLATGDNIVEDLVRQENNSNETILHVAVRNGAHGLVQDLLATDPKLACFPREGTSPLYLAILLEHSTIAQTLYEKSENNVLSYSGPNGQNALHAAVLRGPEFTRKLLKWNKNKDLTTGRDANGIPIAKFVSKYPSSAGLRDAKGTTFLHVAIEKKNADPEVWIHRALKFAGARGDELHRKRAGDAKDSTQSQSIGPVLIATVTFGAMFALPGGYRADDSDYGGTPTLARTFAFHAFMIANTLAFICSTIATLASMYAGSARLNLVRRKDHFGHSIIFMHNSIMALVVAFALGVYTVLSPVAQKTDIAICVMSPLVVLYNFKDFWLNWANFAIPLFVRKGAIWTLRVYTEIILVNMFSVSWLIFVFVWATYGRDHLISKAVSPAQAPATFA